MTNSEHAMVGESRAEGAADVKGNIAALMVYPVKSCAGMSVLSARLLATGLEWDRAWMLVDSEGVFLSQRELPRMALVQPDITLDALRLSAPGMAPLALSLQAGGNACRVEVWDDTVAAFDTGAQAARWFSEFLAIPNCRLVRFNPTRPRLSSHKWTRGIDAPNQFSDGYPVLVTTQAAIEELNMRLSTAGHNAVTMDRFRPNVVLGGMAGHDEDHMDQLRIAQRAQLRLVKPCARCPIPNIDPVTALSLPAVGDALQSYRVDARLNGAVTFGMNAIVLSGVGETLRVGDPVSATYLF